MNEKISYLCPTRGRPDNLTRLVDSLKETSAEAPEIIFYIDEDDEVLKKSWSHLNLSLPVTVVWGKRICLSECWNKCAEVASGNLLMHGGDDIIFRTKNWDNLVKNAFSQYEDKLIFVYGDDGIHGHRFGTHGVLHRRWMDLNGWFCPPYFASDYNDTWFNDVFAGLRRAFYKPFVTEHMHFIVGKAELDQTHKERLERHQKENCTEIYVKTLLERQSQVEKLQKLLGTPYVPADKVVNLDPNATFEGRFLKEITGCS